MGRLLALVILLLLPVEAWGQTCGGPFDTRNIPTGAMVGGQQGNCKFSTVTPGAGLSLTGAFPNFTLNTNAVPSGAISLLNCTGCDLTGNTDSTAALNAYLTANEGATVQCPANARLLFTTGNVTIPPTTGLVGDGSPLGMVGRGSALSSCTFIHDRTHTLIVNQGAKLQWVSVVANDLVTNPTATQVNTAVAAWGLDNSIGVYANQNGFSVQQVFIEGFHFGLVATGNIGIIRDLYLDDWHGLYNAANNIIDHVEALPFYCLSSPACNTVQSARPGTAVYAELATGSITHVNCEMYGQGVFLSGTGQTWLDNETCETAQVVAYGPLGSGPPYNGFGIVGVRGFNSSFNVEKFYNHGYSVVLQLEAGAKGLYDSIQTTNPGLASNTGFVAPIIVAGATTTGNLVTISGTASSGSQVTVTTSGQAPPPAFISLSQTVAGALSATTYYVKLTYTGPGGTETTASNELSFAASANNVLNVAQPPPWSGVTGYNVYASTSSGTEVLQASVTLTTPTTPWVEPTSGLVTGTAMPPVTNNTAWSVQDFYKVGAPGVPANTTTTAQFLEVALNTDATLIGNDIVAKYSGATVEVYGQAAYPPITVTVATTGGLTAAVTPGNTIGAPIGVVRAPTSLADPNPLVLKLGTSNFEWADLPLMNSKNPNKFLGFSQGSDVFPSSRWSNTAQVTGPGCGSPGTNRRDLNGIANVGSTSTGCAVVFGTIMPFPPLCKVTNTGGAVLNSLFVQPATTAGFSWTFTAPGSSQSQIWDCTLNW